jgi:hypothetical protein
MILVKIKAIGRVNIFTFVFRSGRIGSTEWEMLKIYEELLGKECWSNVCCVITHVDFSSDEYEKT